MIKELNNKLIILSFCSNWHSKSFSFGVNITSEPHLILAEGMSFEMLNTDKEIKYNKKREYYICVSLGFWQLSLGVRL